MNVISYPMVRVLHILLFVAFAVTNAAAAPMAFCQHVDATAHSAALNSDDAATSADAHAEDAAGAVGKGGALAEVAASVAAAVLPATGPALGQADAEPSVWFADRAASMVGRTLTPLLDPPLA